MSHYLIAQLNRGRYGSASVLSPEGVDELHRPAVQTSETGTSYGMGWFVGPINGIPAIHHQGETFNFHANAVLVPGSRTGVIVLMNAENSIDLFLTGRMGSISEGVTSLLEGRDPAPAPSAIATFVVYVLLFGIVVLQLRSIVRWVTALRHGRVPRGRIGPRVRIALALALSLGWAVLVLVLVPKQLGLPLLVVAQGLPDLAYILLMSGVRSLCAGGSSDRSGRTRRCAGRAAAGMWLVGQMQRASLRAGHEHDHLAPDVQAGGLARLASAVTRETVFTPDRGRNRRPPHRRRQLPPARARYPCARPPRERTDSRRGPGGYRNGVPTPTRPPAGDQVGGNPRQESNLRTGLEARALPLNHAGESRGGSSRTPESQHHDGHLTTSPSPVPPMAATISITAPVSSSPTASSTVCSASSVYPSPWSFSISRSSAPPPGGRGRPSPSSSTVPGDPASRYRDLSLDCPHRALNRRRAGLCRHRCHSNVTVVSPRARSTPRGQTGPADRRPADGTPDEADHATRLKNAATRGLGRACSAA